MFTLPRSTEPHFYQNKIPTPGTVLRANLEFCSICPCLFPPYIPDYFPHSPLFIFHTPHLFSPYTPFIFPITLFISHPSLFIFPLEAAFQYVAINLCFSWLKSNKQFHDGFYNPIPLSDFSFSTNKCHGDDRETHSINELQKSDLLLILKFEDNFKTFNL